jgi:hypothetical protein
MLRFLALSVVPILILSSDRMGTEPEETRELEVVSSGIALRIGDETDNAKESRKGRRLVHLMLTPLMSEGPFQFNAPSSASGSLLGTDGPGPFGAPWSPWYLLAAPLGGCGPANGWNCGTATIPQLCPWTAPGTCAGFINTATWLPFISAPYAFSVLPPATPLDPNTIATNPLHQSLGVVRHWPTSALPVPVVIHVPFSQGLASTTDIFAGSLPQPYYWSDYVNDVTATFAKYTSGVQTTLAGVTISVAYSSSPAWTTKSFPVIPPPPPLTPGGGSPPLTQVSGVLTWDNRGAIGLAPYDGPTGNGTNDVIFLTYNHVGGVGGICSMLVDPVSGEISEADVIFDMASFSSGNSGVGGLQPLAGQPWHPRETTAFAHEIGHFFGLDHSNLHVGNTGIGSTSLPCPGQTANPAFLAPYAPSLASCYTPDTVPPSLRHSAIVLSEYPGMTGAVVTSGTSDHVALPLHNDDAVGMSMLYPVIGPLVACPLSTLKLPLINTSAIIRGHIVDTTGRGVFGANVLPSLHAAGSQVVARGLPQVGVVSGFFRLSASEVIGSGVNAPPSGGFDCQGVPARPGGASLTVPLPSGIAYDVAVEPVESVGIQVGPAGTFTFGEWVEENLLNPAPTNTWVSASVSTGVVASEANGPVRSIEVAPGSIIDLRIVHNGSNQPEQVTRPLVQITPRTCRPVAPNNVTVTVISNFALHPQAIAMSVNGVPVANLSSFHVPPNPAAYPAGTNTWIIPVAALTLPGGQARLRFTATERVTAPGVSHLPGVNELVY